MGGRWVAMSRRSRRRPKVGGRRRGEGLGRAERPAGRTILTGRRAWERGPGSEARERGEEVAGPAESGEVIVVERVDGGRRLEGSG